MDILVVLRKLGELETETAKLYEWFTTLFDDDLAAKEFFYKLSEDEKAHFDLVKYQERVVRKAPKDFAPVDVDIAAMSTSTDAKSLGALRTTRSWYFTRSKWAFSSSDSLKKNSFAFTSS